MSTSRLAMIKMRACDTCGCETEFEYLVPRVEALEKVRKAAENWRDVSARQPSGRVAAEAWQGLMTALLEAPL